MMKRFLILVLSMLFVLCSCQGGAEGNISSKIETESDKSSLSKWNTVDFQNVYYGNFAFDSENDSIIYCKSELKNDKYSYSLMSRKGEYETKIMDGPASSIYVFEGKIYYSDEDCVYSVNLDGTDKKELSEINSAYCIMPYKDGFFCRNADFEIHQVLNDGTDKLIETEQNVIFFMIYNGCLYYCGYEEEISESLNLRCYNIEKKKDKAIAENIVSFDIVSDTIYAVNTDYSIVSMNLDGSNEQEVIKGEVEREIYAKSDGLIYFVQGECLKYDFDNKQSKTIANVENSAWSLCGDYLCNYSPYSEIEYSFEKIL